MTMWFCLVAVLGGLALTPVAANAQWYQLRVKHSQKCLDVAWYSMVDGGDIVQSWCTANPIQTNQTWDITGDYYFATGQRGLDTSGFFLMAKHSGKMMDVLNNSTAHAANVVQWGWDSSDLSQMWDFVHAVTENGIRWYKIQNVHSGKCLDVAWFSQAAGGDVLQANCTGTDNQLWRADIINTP